MEGDPIMKIIILPLTLLCGILFVTFPVNSEIYKWTDAHGKVHFTDNPPHNKKAVEVDLQINTYTAVEVTPLVERLGRSDKVVMYSTSKCGYCKKAKRYFKSKGIAYVSYDVNKSRTGKRDFKRLRGTGVPIIIVGDKRMNGFSESRFDRLYQRHLKKQEKKENEAEESLNNQGNS